MVAQVENNPNLKDPKAQNEALIASAKTLAAKAKLSVSDPEFASILGKASAKSKSAAMQAAAQQMAMNSMNPVYQSNFNNAQEAEKKTTAYNAMLPQLAQLRSQWNDARRVGGMFPSKDQDAYLSRFTTLLNAYSDSIPQLRAIAQQVEGRGGGWWANADVLDKAVADIGTIAETDINANKNFYTDPTLKMNIAKTLASVGAGGGTKANPFTMKTNTALGAAPAPNNLAGFQGQMTPAQQKIFDANQQGAPAQVSGQLPPRVVPAAPMTEEQYRGPAQRPVSRVKFNTASNAPRGG
jgi:hypothetical protein